MELGRKHEIHPTQISSWKAQFLQHAGSVFEQPVKDAKTEAQEKEDHYLKVIGQQKVEIDFLKKSLVMNKSRAQRMHLVDKAIKVRVPNIGNTQY